MTPAASVSCCLPNRASLNTHPLIRDLGTEPTGNRLDGALAGQALPNKAAPLKAALLDQKLIAGLGNIYVCEAHVARRTFANATWRAVSRAKTARLRTCRDRLATSIRSVIADAIKAGGSSLKDYRQADGELGYFQHSFSVYDREGSLARATVAMARCRVSFKAGARRFTVQSVSIINGGSRMTYENIIVETREKVGFIQLNRPQGAQCVELRAAGRTC